MRTRVLADGQKTKKTHTKYDENIGRHLKNQQIGTPKVFQRLYVFHLYAQRNHSLSARGRRNSTGLAELWGGWPIEQASLVVGIFANFCPLVAFDS